MLTPAKKIRAKRPRVAGPSARRVGALVDRSLSPPLLLVLAAVLALAQARAATLSLHWADYDAELRRADGHVDSEAMVRRLKELGVTTYYWLIWHAPTDWEDLKQFLPLAAQAKIQTWAYLVPPTEGPSSGSPASEPFKEDYLRWAEEIARLSLQQTNLSGWVIDDFYANHKFFSPAYVGQMQAKAKAINPRLLFLPLMYFPEITPGFVTDYQKVVDGVIVAYPDDLAAIVHARAILNGEASSMPGELSCPGDTATKAGDFVSARIPVSVLSADRASLRFVERDDFTGPTSGYHYKQVLLDNVVVWERDVAGGSNGWQAVQLDVTRWVKGKTNATLAFRLLDKKGVSNFGIHWRVKDLRPEGLQLSANLAKSQRWLVDHHGPFTAGFGAPVRAANHTVHLPLIVMTAASPEEFRMRHGDPASPERITDWLRMCLQAWRDRQCDGVVTYCLDKRPDSRPFSLAQRAFGDFRPR